MRDSKAAGSKVIEVVAKLQPLKARPKLEADNFAVHFMIGVVEKRLKPISSIAS